MRSNLLLRSDELGEHLGLAQNAYRWRVSMARIRELDGDPCRGRGPARPSRTRVRRGLLTQRASRCRRCEPGCGSAKDGWPRRRIGRASRAFAARDDLTYVHEYEHITLARLLLALHVVEGADDLREQATELLDRLLSAAEDGRRMGSVIEILVVQALALRLAGDDGAAAVVAAAGRRPGRAGRLLSESSSTKARRWSPAPGIA